jgi:putative transposase
MDQLRLTCPMPMLKRLLKVSASGFYDWKMRSPSKREQEEVRLEVAIQAAHQRTRQTYGPLRLQHELKAQGLQVGICRIRRIRKKLGIRCKQKRRFKVTTDSKHSLPVADNLLKQNFKVDRPNRIWVSDITYIPTDEGWLYLAGHKDLFTHEIVGYAMGERLSRYLVSQSIYQALGWRQPEAGLISHSDRGSQYCAEEYQNILKEKGIQISMSRRGNCYDNAPMESFWGTLKQELIYHRHYTTRQEAMQDIREYIEIFYNRQRIQEELGYLSPAAFAQLYRPNILKL